MATRIVLIHATNAAVEPVQSAFAARWPEADVVNLLDDSLSPDRDRDGDLTPEMSERIAALARYASSIGADAILYTCSAFGPAIEAVARGATLPVLKPNQAMFERALDAGAQLGMLATFAPSVRSMEDEFAELAMNASSKARLRTIVVPEAMAALRRGDAATHNRLLAEAAPELAGCDAVMLAHFSTSRALQAVSAVVSCPVLTSPDAAVDAIRRRCAA